MEYNVYCDETNHLKINKGEYMAIGAIYLPKSRVKKVNRYLRDLKSKYGLKDNQELKWNLIKNSSIDLYLDIVKYFFNGENDIKFRAILINKDLIDNETYNQTDDDFYYKMYYTMLKYLITPDNSYNIYPDIKDTDSYFRHQQVLEFSRIKQKDLNGKTLKKIQPIKSFEAPLMQLTDIMIGALVYYNNYPENKNKNKEKVINEIISDVKINNTTPYNNTKFNLLYWRSKDDIDN